MYRQIKGSEDQGSKTHHTMETKLVKLFLRFAIAVGFLSAVADRFGLWNYHLAWGNWDSFVAYTQTLLPSFSAGMVEGAALIATAAEVVLAILLIIGWKTSLVARLSGLLMLIFALAMSFSGGIKTAFDASVFTAVAAAFSLGTMKEKFLEVA